MSSVWLDTAPEAPAFPALEEHLTADVCVVGGGIVGVTTALVLHEAGARVVLVEADRIGDRPFACVPALHPERSYAIACRIAGAPPEGMFISAGGPTRSVRAVPVGGEDFCWGVERAIAPARAVIRSGVTPGWRRSRATTGTCVRSPTGGPPRTTRRSTASRTSVG